ncbi:MAG: sugar ABC transporter substrate-binding protein [Caldilineaceae bacterium]
MPPTSILGCGGYFGAACCFACSAPVSVQRWPGSEWLTGIWGAQATPTPAPVTTTVHFATWAASDAVDAYFRQRLAAYQQRQPGTQVDYLVLPNYATRLRTALESVDPPDVVRINAFILPDLVDRGMLAPLPAWLVEQATLSPLLHTMTTVDGTPYCLPHEVNTLALLYNSALFDAAQLPYPTAAWTWDTLRTTAEQLTDADAGHYGLSLPADMSRWLAFLYQAGGSVADPTYTTMTMNSPEAVNALQVYTNLVLDGMAASPAMVGSSWSGEAFAQGQAAMIIEGNWIIPYLREQAPTLAYGVAPLPAGPAGQATVAFANCYAIAAGTANPVAAAALIDFLTSAESQTGWLSLTAALPTRSDVQDRWSIAYPTQLAFAQGLPHAHPWRFAPNFQPVVEQMNDGIQRIYGGFLLAEGVLSEVEIAGNERLQP